MVHAEGGDFQGARGDPLTQRTSPVFFDVLGVLLAAKVTVVAEAAFQDRLWRQGLEPLVDLARLRIVQCRVDAAVSLERAARRSAADEAHRSAHGDSPIGTGIEEWQQALASFGRVSIPAPSIDVDTTDGYAPDIAEIVDFIDRQKLTRADNRAR